MSSAHLSSHSQLRDTYRKLKDRIAEAAVRSGRHPEDVALVTVTKDASLDQIRALTEMGQLDLGESRVQQFIQRAAVVEEIFARRRTLGGAVTTKTAKHPEPPPHIRWHLVGHLQRNKVKQILPLVYLIHSIDSLRLAEELHAIAGRADRTLDILLQINASRETSKFGVAPAAALHLAEQIQSMMSLRLRGLMAMAAYSENPEDARSDFARTAEIYHEMRTAKVAGPDFNILSMGMSGDFEVAIEEGANVVRIGQALFGPPQSAE